jgi:serine/threonine protein kinase
MVQPKVLVDRVRKVDGTTADVRYQVVRKVGSGAFAIVYKVLKEGTDKVFAAKVIIKASLKQPQQKKKVLS